MNIFKRLFSFSGRIDRYEFRRIGIAPLIVGFAVGAVAKAYDVDGPLFSLIFLAGFAIHTSAVTRRLRDVGVGGYFLYLATIINVILAYPFSWIWFGFQKSWDEHKGLNHILALLKHISRAGNFGYSATPSEVKIFDQSIEIFLGLPERFQAIARADFLSRERMSDTIGFHASALKAEADISSQMLSDLLGVFMAMAHANGAPAKEKLDAVDKILEVFAVKPPLPASVPELVGLAAKLAKADGRVAQAEIEAIDDFLRYAVGLTEQMRREAIAVFKRAKDDSRPFTSYADAFADKASDELHKELAFRVLLDIALADGELHEKEVEILEYVARSFGIAHDFGPQDTGRREKATGQDESTGKKERSGDDREKTTDLKDEVYYCKILGIEPGAGKSEIKKAFVSQQQKNHPDKVSHMSEAIRRFANDELVKINEAYEFFRKAGRV